LFVDGDFVGPDLGLDLVAVCVEDYLVWLLQGHVAGGATILNLSTHGRELSAGFYLVAGQATLRKGRGVALRLVDIVASATGHRGWTIAAAAH
jgi:hypothetical protein